MRGAGVGELRAELRAPNLARALNIARVAPPPRSSIQIDALMCSSPKTIRQVASRSKSDGMPSSMYVRAVTLFSFASSAAVAGSVSAFLWRYHSER